jgi:predicted transcriptional regulator
MLPNLSEIKAQRKKLNITQNELSNLTNISQSLITKIESGKLEPTYNKAKKIFETLQNLSHKKTKKAKDIMNKNIIKLYHNDELRKAILIMKKHGISQIPVYNENKMVGFISESILLDSIIENKRNFVSEVMHERPPTISEDTPIEIISTLLKYSPLIIVFGNGKAKGIITKSDVLNSL